MIVHNLDPVLVDFGLFELRWYSLAYILGIILGWVYAIKIIKEIIDQEIPTFGICLGHQILALALGGKTNKMHQGHHGANHPVKDMESGQVTITSMNHGFAVDYKSLPSNIIQTHLSLFDESNCGIKISNKPIFSVQHHPEASPGPNDSYYLFDKFLNLVERNKYA